MWDAKLIPKAVVCSLCLLLALRSGRGYGLSYGFALFVVCLRVFLLCVCVCLLPLSYSKIFVSSLRRITRTVYSVSVVLIPCCSALLPSSPPLEQFAQVEVCLTFIDPVPMLEVVKRVSSVQMPLPLLLGKEGAVGGNAAQEVLST